MRWHDGKPVTAEDVKFSFDYHKKWKAPFFLPALSNVVAVEVPSANTVRIRLENPSAPFVSTVLAGMFLIPKHIWESIPEKAGVDDPLKFANDKPVGSGPFKLRPLAARLGTEGQRLPRALQPAQVRRHHPHRVRQP